MDSLPTHHIKSLSISWNLDNAYESHLEALQQGRRRLEAIAGHPGESHESQKVVVRISCTSSSTLPTFHTHVQPSSITPSNILPLIKWPEVSTSTSWPWYLEPTIFQVFETSLDLAFFPATRVWNATQLFFHRNCCMHATYLEYNSWWHGTISCASTPAILTSQSDKFFCLLTRFSLIFSMSSCLFASLHSSNSVSVFLFSLA